MSLIQHIWRNALQLHHSNISSKNYRLFTVYNICNNDKMEHTAVRYRSSTSRSKLSSSTTNSPPIKLSHNLRQLIKLIHPDLYTQYPAEQLVNTNNLSKLLEIINDIKSNKLDDAYPESRHITLQFYVKCDKIKLSRSTSGHHSVIDELTQLRYNAINTAAGKNITDKLIKQNKSNKNNQSQFQLPSNIWSGWYITQPCHQFYCIQLTISLNGGNCKKLLSQSMSVLFALTGLPTSFVWDTEYFIDKQQRIHLNEDMNDQCTTDDVSEEAEYQRLMKQQANIDKMHGYA